MGVVHLPAKHIPALLDIIVAHCAQQFYLYDGKVIVGVAFHIIYIAHGADALFQYVRHFQFHLMGGCSRISSYNHGEFHLYLRIFQLTHVIA